MASAFKPAVKSAVIVPSYNRPDTLRACLAALVCLDPAPDEIIVVDDGGKTPLAPVAAEFGVRCVRQENAGPAAARNTGVAASDAGFIALTDDDCRPRPGWLGALIEAWDGAPSRQVGGHVENVLTENVYAAASQSLSDYLYTAADVASGGAEFFTSNNLGGPREMFDIVGGFDTGFPGAAGEDRDLGRRWREAGGDLVFAPDAVVDHAHDMNLAGFWRQQSNYGGGARILHERMATPTLKDADPESPFKRPAFYLNLVTHPLRDGRTRALQRSGLLALAQVATAYGYACARAR